MDHGWIKLHRSILDWEWYSDQNTMRVFFHLLIKANHKEKKRYGETIKTGSLLTGRKALAYELGLSEQQIRTSLNKLKSTSEITIKSTNKNSIISITNWDLYQVSNQQDNNPVTNNQPASNQQVTTNKNVIKEEVKKTNTHLAMLVSMGVDDQIAKEWLSVRKLKKLQPTQTAFNSVKKQADIVGMTMNEAVKKAVEEGWAGFKAKWITEPRNENNNNENNPIREIL